MFTIKLKLHPASTMVDQAETKEEASYGLLMKLQMRGKSHKE
jgi:hypothetical protein